MLPGLKEIIEVGFQAYHKGETPMNAALSYKSEKCDHRCLAKFYSRLSGVQVQPGVAGGTFWGNGGCCCGCPAGTGMAGAGVAAGCGVDGQADCSGVQRREGVFIAAQGVAVRSALTFDLQLPLDFSGDQVQVWYSFVSADGKVVSNSVYVGMVTVL